MGRPFPVRGPATALAPAAPSDPLQSDMVRLLAAATVLACLGILPASADAQEPPDRRAVTVVARDYQFTPDVIEVTQDEVVTITLQSEDRPYSIAIDAYRIARRAAGGQRVTIEFRADQAGRFPFYCNITSDPRCREMRGVLIVNPR